MDLENQISIIETRIRFISRPAQESDSELSPTISMFVQRGNLVTAKDCRKILLSTFTFLFHL